MAKQRHSRKGSHWAERNMWEMNVYNAALGTEKRSRENGLSAPPLAGRVTLGKSHKPFMTWFPGSSKLNLGNPISSGFWYSEFSFPCWLFQFLFSWFFFLAYHSVIAYHLLNTVLGTFTISYSSSPNYTLERHVLFFLYACNVLEVTQRPGVNMAPGFILTAEGLVTTLLWNAPMNE